jgi:hypothetical protein
MYVCMCTCASGVAEAGIVKQTLVKPEGCLPDAISIRAYPCDVVLSDVLCDSLQDYHALVANKHQIIFGGLYL